MPATELYAYVPAIATPIAAGPATILVDQIIIPSELGAIEEIHTVSVGAHGRAPACLNDRSIQHAFGHILAQLAARVTEIAA